MVRIPQPPGQREVRQFSEGQQDLAHQGLAMGAFQPVGMVPIENALEIGGIGRLSISTISSIKKRACSFMDSRN
jgi:hypothetical protein